MSTNEGNVTRVTVNLIFNAAYRQDTGEYECQATNLLKTVARKFSVIVQCMQFSYTYMCIQLYGITYAFSVAILIY